MSHGVPLVSSPGSAGIVAAVAEHHGDVADVTAELGARPIIDQDLVLARAVAAHVEHRVVPVGGRTVVPD